MKLKLVVSGLLIMMFSTSISVAEEQLAPEKLAIKTACADEAKKAGCESMEVGHGYIKCLHEFKKKNKKDFKYSEGCKDALKNFRTHKKELKGK